MKRFRKHWLYIGLTLFVLLVAAYYIGGHAAGIAKPWVWNRDDNAVAKQHAGLRISAHAGFSKSSINAATALSTSQSGNSAVDFSHIAVRSASEHPLAIACAEQIAERLKTIPAIQRIDFAPYSPIIGKEEPLPPQLIWIDVDDLNETSVWNRSLTGKISVAFGSSGFPQSFATTGTDTPPLVNVEQRTTIDIHFTHTGISSQSVFYNKIAEQVAKKAVDSIGKEIDKMSQSTPMLPKLPEAFYPAYREASGIPPIPGFASKTTFIDGRRFMMPHYSLVQIESNFAGTDDEFLTTIQEAMSEDDWKGGVNKQGEFNSAYMRLTRGIETFYMFKERCNRSAQLDIIRRDGFILNDGREPLPDDGPPHVFLLERTEKMPQDSVLSAIQTLLDENASPSVLLMFIHRLYGNRETVKELEMQIRERLLDWRTGTPAEQLSLAQFFYREEDKEIAKTMLFKAWQIRQLTLNPLPDSSYTQLAKDLGIEEEMKALPPPTPELCKEYGFIFLMPENCPMEVEIEIEKEARFVTVNEDGHLSFLHFTFHRENDTYHSKGVQRTFREHGHSRMTWSRHETLGGISLPYMPYDLPRGDRERFAFSVLSEALPVLRVRVEFRER